mmetsp:Transcript_84328/g.243377  ORF Transcript_84328/g.243377 Transcript_84328/m.243377 type:complete len:236 (-) Transcript_84328:827-1534(-)
MPDQHDSRPRLTTVLQIYLEDSHLPIVACCGDDVGLRRMPNNADHGLRVADPLQDAARLRVDDASEGVRAASDDAALAPMVPLATEALGGVNLLSDLLGACVWAPNEQPARAAHCADPLGTRADCQAIEDLVRAGIHFALAFSRRDSPHLHVAVVGGRRQHIRVVRMKCNVEDGLRMARRRHEAQLPRGNVADAHGAVLKGHHEPIRFARDRLDAIHAGSSDLDLRERRSLRHIP